MVIFTAYRALARPLAASPRVFAPVVRLVRRPIATDLPIAPATDLPIAPATDLPIAPATAARKPPDASVPDRCR
jgi:hypothetical protein